MNARFWVTHRDGWVKLTLRPGQSLEVGHSSPDEEGYSFTHGRYTHEGDHVRNEWCNGGRDCDGTIQRDGVSVCPIGFLRVRDLGRDRWFCGTATPDGHNILLPEWEKAGDERIHDEYAIAAGY